MGSIKSYKDLLIWQKGIVLVIRVYQFVKSFLQEESKMINAFSKTLKS
jgi:hypothetical protein